MNLDKLMLDINFIRENSDLIAKAAKDKNINFDVKKLLDLDTQRRELQQKTDELRAQKNRASKSISQLEGDERQKAIAEMKTVSDEEKSLSEELSKVEKDFKHQMLLAPTPASKETPVGKDDSENKELYTWGEKPKFDFEMQDHVTLGENLDLFDIPRGVKIAGTRSYFLKGDGARLELAILMYTLDKLVKKGFTTFIPPLLVNYEAMMGTSYFPGGEEQAYAVGVMKPEAKNEDSEGNTLIHSDEKYLIGTSEVAVASYHADETLSEDELPKLYAGYSNCFRREAGTYGKDTHGLYRIHQFQKVEQVIICKNDMEESKRLHEMILKNAEEVLQDLKLPYRVVAVCTGDMGQGQYYKNDIETWMPSRESYGETHSCSTFRDFQSRRLNLKYKDKEGKTHYCHTLNNTCIASPRVLIPILEIYQNADGTVSVPEVLRPYMGGQEKIGT